MTVAEAIGLVREHERLRWVTAIALYGVGDAVTTAAGLATAGPAEIGPLVAPLVERHGAAGLVAAKALTFAIFYAAWRALATPGRVAVPLALTIVGAAVTGWNVAVLLVG